MSLLGKITHYDPVDRVAASVPASVRARLELYLDEHEKTHGERPSLGDLVMAMAAYVMDNDKAFQKKLRENPKAFEAKFQELCAKARASASTGA